MNVRVKALRIAAAKKKERDDRERKDWRELNDEMCH